METFKSEFSIEIIMNYSRWLMLQETGAYKMNLNCVLKEILL